MNSAQYYLKKNICSLVADVQQQFNTHTRTEYRWHFESKESKHKGWFLFWIFSSKMSVCVFVKQFIFIMYNPEMMVSQNPEDETQMLGFLHKYIQLQCCFVSALHLLRVQHSPTSWEGFLSLFTVKKIHFLHVHISEMIVTTILCWHSNIHAVKQTL